MTESLKILPSIKSKKRKINRFQRWPLYALGVIWILVFTAYIYFDNDTWFILSTGREMLKQGTILYENPFISTSGQNIVVQQWLWCLIVYGIYHIGGRIGLYLFTVILEATLVGLGIHVYRKLTKKHIGGEALCVILLLLMNPYLSTRPTLVTQILLILTVFFVEQFIRKNHWRYLIGLVALSVACINLHAALWPMMFLFMLPYFIPNFWPFTCVAYHNFTSNKQKGILLITAITMILVGFANPYGVEGMLYLFNSYGGNLIDLGINELQKPVFLSLFGILYLGSVAVLAFRLHKRHLLLSWVGFCLLAGTSLLFFMHVKDFSYAQLGLFFCFTFLDTYKQGYEENQLVLPPILNKLVIRSIGKGLIVVCIFLFTLVFFSEAPTFFSKQPKDSLNTPVQFNTYIQKQGIDKENVKIYNEMSTGGWLSWEGYKVYVDARPELGFESITHDQGFYLDYQQSKTIGYDVSIYEKFICEHDFQYYIVSRTNPLYLFLSTNECSKCIVTSDTYFVFEVQPIDC